MFQENEKDFFFKVVDGQVKFATGKMTGFLFEQGSGSGMPAPKIG